MVASENQGPEAAEAAAGAIALKPSALFTLLRANLVGMFLTSKAGRRLLIGKGKINPSPFNSLRIIGQFSNELAADQEKMVEKGEAIRSFGRNVMQKGESLVDYAIRLGVKNGSN